MSALPSGATRGHVPPLLWALCGSQENGPWGWPACLGPGQWGVLPLPPLLQPLCNPFCSSWTSRPLHMQILGCRFLLNSYASSQSPSSQVPASIPPPPCDSPSFRLPRRRDLCLARHHSGLTGSLFCSTASTKRTYRWPGSRPLLSKPPYCFWSPGWKVDGNTEKRAAM